VCRFTEGSFSCMELHSYLTLLIHLTMDKISCPNTL
jgi:hypothetical protein